MKKPWWIRTVGILALLCAALAAGMFFTPPSPRTGIGQVAGVYFFGSAAAVLFAAWAVMSFVIYVIGRAARQSAAIQRDVLKEFGESYLRGGLPADHRVTNMAGNVELKQSPAAAPVTPSQNAGVWDNPPTNITCDGCKRPHAMLYCKRHSRFMCFPCAARHDAEDCSYVAAGREFNKSRRQPAASRPVGKVLGI